MHSSSKSTDWTRLKIAFLTIILIFSAALFVPQSKASLQNETIPSPVFVSDDDDALSGIGDSIDELIKEADSGSVEAMVVLGDCYAKGTFVQQDHAKAFQYYKRVADSNDEEYAGMTATAVGEMYLQGLGVAKDNKKAFEYFTRAAEANCELAYFSQGLCYQNGWGIDKDDVKAIELFNKAIEEGDARGKLGLAIAYGNGSGGFDRAPERAKQLIHEAKEEVNIPTFGVECDKILAQIDTNAKGEAAYNLGYRLGYLAGRLLCVGIIIALIVFLVMKFSKR